MKRQAAARRVSRRVWAVLFLGAALLSGCHRSAVIQSLPRSAGAPFGPVPLSQVDLGASVLAEVENARFAIAARAPVAAANDLTAAMTFALELSYKPSKIMGAESPSGPHPVHVPLTDFGARADLTSAQAELPGNFAAADAQLRHLQNRIPQALIPRDLPLLCAAASLDLARFDASVGQLADLKTQLLSARSALGRYTGPGHVADAKALAATIDQASSPRAVSMMMPSEPGAWLTQVVEWAGTDRWNVPTG